MKFQVFEVGSIIKLREGMGTFPASDSYQEERITGVVPLYLNMNLNYHIKEKDILLVLESIKKNYKEEYPVAYRCLREKNIVYIYDFKEEGINLHVCFKSCK